MSRRPIEGALLGLLLWSGQPLPLAAADAVLGEVRFLAGLDEPAWVGQEIELYLELWSNGFSFGDQLFVLPEVKGAFLLQGDSSTVKLSETRAGASWQGLRYTLLLYPQTAGRLQVPSFEVSFTSRAGFDSEPAAFRQQTGPLAIEARLPPGVSAGDLLITTGSFELEAQWDRALSGERSLQLQTGDAITLEVRRRAADVPGMVFTPLPLPEIEGLGVYPASPIVRDQVNRGELTGLRIDSVTFVCESTGQFSIPEFRFQWWNPEEERLAERVIPAVALEVAANPAFGAGTGAVEAWSGGRLAALLAAVAVALMAGLLVWRWRRAKRGTPEPAGRLRSRPTPPEQRDGRLLPLNPGREN
jgi:hypothetical protein